MIIVMKSSVNNFIRSFFCQRLGIKFPSKIVVFLMTFILMGTALFSQNDPINSLDNKGLKHGLWRKMEDGKLLYEGKFNHGNPVGKFTYFYEDGKTVKSISNFSANGIIAHVTSFHINGKTSSYGKYYDKLKDSTWVYFGDNGTKISEEQYKLGKKNGVWKKFDYEKGVVLEEMGWKNDLQHGVTQAFTLDGKLKYKFNYKDGKANGPYLANYPSGQLFEKGVYKNSLKDSISTNFDESGKVIRKRKWLNGFVDWDKLWIWTDAGKKEVELDSISYIYRKAGHFIVVTTKGTRIKGNGEWTSYVEFLNEKVFMNFTSEIYGSVSAPRRIEEIEEGVYKIIFKQDIGFDVIMKDSELGFLKSMRPKLFKKK